MTLTEAGSAGIGDTEVAALVIDLTPELEQRLRDEAERRGLSAADCARELLSSSLLPKFDGTVGPALLQMVDQIMAGVSEEELAKLPSDLSANLDHYLYGAPKKP